MAAPTAGHQAATRLDISEQGGDVVVKLHMQEILRLRDGADLTLSAGGWFTASTMETINQSIGELLPGLGVSIATQDGDESAWILKDASGFTIPFVDGIVIPTTAEAPLKAPGRPSPALTTRPTPLLEGRCSSPSGQIPALQSPKSSPLRCLSERPC